jgi:hypothetical protein
MSSPAHRAVGNPGATPRVSVVIPIFNARAELPSLVDALLDQTFPRSETEFIFVDDGSTDDSADWIASELGPPFRIVSYDKRRGSYWARNVGIRAARAPIIAFTDADCRPARNWLTAGMAGMAGRQRGAGHVALTTSSSTPSLVELVDASRFLRQRRYALEGWAATANAFVCRDVLERVGAFDPRLVSGGDWDMGMRAEAAGIPIGYFADAQVAHPCRRRFSALARKAFRVGFGRGQLLRLHGAGPKPLLGLMAGRMASAWPPTSAYESLREHNMEPRTVPIRIGFSLLHLVVSGIWQLGCLWGYRSTRAPRPRATAS